MRAPEAPKTPLDPVTEARAQAFAEAALTALNAHRLRRTPMQLAIEFKQTAMRLRGE